MLQIVNNLFYFDPIALIMLSLALFTGICIGTFSHRYMRGDTRYKIFFVYLALLILSISTMVCANHIAVLFGGWCISNALLVRLMIHKASWKAAKNSGVIAARNYLLGGLCVGSALLLLTLSTGETSIKALTHQNLQTAVALPALLLLLVGGMTQSAIWPFHRWLVSSLNSPTPVSALMHAGLVNGGGFLLVRFAPLFLDRKSVV